MENILFSTTGDAVCKQSTPDTNFGTDAINSVGYATDARRFFAKFNFAALPETAIIDSATLRIYRVGFTPAATSMSFDVNAVTEDWVESTVTYNTMPSVTEDNAVTNWELPNRASTTMESLDITDLFIAMVASDHSSIRIKATIEASGSSTMLTYSREAGASGGLTRVTEIYVEYETPVPTDPDIDAISTITENSNEFTWSDSTCDVFESSELYYEMAISLDGGATYGSTLTSAEGDAAYTVNFRTYLGLGASQYYYNANVKIKVRAKTPAYEGTVYYSEWVESSLFAISYPTPAPTPVYADDSGIIDAYWWMPASDFGYPNAEKTLMDVYFTGWGTTAAGAAGGQVKLTAYYNRNGYWRTKEKTFTLLTGKKPHHWQLNLNGRLFKFLIENVEGSAINMTGLELIFEVNED